VAADALVAVRPYSESLFSAIFVESLPGIGTGQCVERAETLGLPGGDFARELGPPGTERRLAETAGEARSAGAFGVPTFAFDGSTLWGNDRRPCCATTLHRGLLVFERDFSTGKAGFAARTISVADGGSACFGAGRTVETHDGLGPQPCLGGARTMLGARTMRSAHRCRTLAGCQDVRP
jgi:hypothetical protein